MNAPHLLARGVGVFNYKGLSLATGGILAVLREMKARQHPQVVSAMGLMTENFYQRV